MRLAKATKLKRSLIVATNNAHKIKEFNDLLSETQLEIKAASSLGTIDWQEIGQSFQANAQIKVEALAKLTEQLIISDDSGLVVDALGGAPGIYSSRYAGEEATDRQNLEKLLYEMSSLEDRRAYFVCCLCFRDKNSKLHFFEGRCHGSIARQPKGLGGFGYDPVFIPDNQSRCLAEFSDFEKIKSAIAAEQWINSFTGCSSLSQSFFSPRTVSRIGLSRSYPTKIWML